MLCIVHHTITLLVLTTSVSAFGYEEYEVDFEMASNNWPGVYVDYCGYTCHNGSKVRTQSGTYCQIPSCYDCDCGHHCLVKGTCCPLVYEEENNIEKIVSKAFGQMDIHDLYHRTSCEWIPFRAIGGKTVLTKSRCPNSWKDVNVRQKCEHPSFDSMESITFINDVKTGMSFRNIYCVQCNGLEPNMNISQQSFYSRTGNLTETATLRSISYAFTCDSYDEIYYATDSFDVFKFAWYNDNGLCSITIDSDDNFIGCERDDMSLTTETMFDSCPTNSSPILRDLCHNLPPVLGLRVVGAKNLFCSLCNVPSKIDRDYCWKSSEPYFMNLFGTSKKENLEDRMEICGSTKTSRKEKVGCLPVSCPAGKVTRDDYVTCQTAVDEIRGLSYQFMLILSPEHSIPRYLWESFANATHSLLSQSIPFTKITYKISLSTCYFDDELFVPEIHFDGHIRAPKNLSRDEFENEIIKVFQDADWRVLISDDSDDDTHNVSNVSLRIICLGKTIRDVYDSQSNAKNCTVHKVFGSKFHQVQTEMNHIDISSELTCPYVIIEQASGPLVLNRTIHVSLEINNQRVNVVWNPSSMSYANGSVHICLHFYKRLVKELEKSRKSTDRILLVHYYLDIVCILVSCVLLSASIMTYLSFPSLRTVPGLNTLCLCVSLLTAQVSLLLTSVFSSPLILREVYCVVHGVILHYSWVASFTWMNTCCIHMYRVFTGNITGSKQQQFTWNCVYSFGFPLLVVITTIIVTAVSTNGNSIGYDKTTCFLDTNTSILIIVMGLLVPLLLTVLTNTVLFGMTMREIIAIRRLKKDHKNHQGVVTYVKLSAVTGLSCLVTATAIQFNNPILSLIASPLAGLQGVFIFFSFTANRRVLKLYKDFISRRKTHFSEPTLSRQISSTRNTVKIDQCLN